MLSGDGSETRSVITIVSGNPIPQAHGGRCHVDYDTDLNLLLPKSNAINDVGPRGSIWLGISLKFRFEHRLIFRAVAIQSAFCSCEMGTNCSYLVLLRRDRGRGR